MLPTAIQWLRGRILPLPLGLDNWRLLRTLRLLLLLRLLVILILVLGMLQQLLLMLLLLLLLLFGLLPIEFSRSRGFSRMRLQPLLQVDRNPGKWSSGKHRLLPGIALLLRRRWLLCRRRGLIE